MALFCKLPKLATKVSKCAIDAGECQAAAVEGLVQEGKT